jgi:uncharacterized phage protein gp47/JayE
MSAPEFTNTGIVVQTYQEIYDELVAGYQAIYGVDINVAPDSPDGQRIGIEAQARLDLQTFALALYNAFDPDIAAGLSLNRIIKLAGITRRAATRSQVDVSVTTDRALTLPDDYTVQDDLGQSWITLEEVVIASATTQTVTLFAQEFGALEADPATVTQPVTVVLGVTAVTNAAAATVGVDEETDQELRERRNLSLETPTSSGTGRMFTALGSVANVTDVAVYENDTTATDSRGIPAHSLWVVIEGGSVDDIVETMAKNKTGGTGTFGDEEGDWTETVVRPDGTDFEIVHEMKFDRPTEIAVSVRLNVEKKTPSSVIDSDLIKQKIAARRYSIGENMLAGDLYASVLQAGTGFVPSVLEIDRGDGWVDDWVEADPDEKFTIAVGDITVTDIT